MTEKMKPGENPMLSAQRAVAEELGIEAPSIIEDLGVEEEQMISPSYPGLNTRYLTHAMRTELPGSTFNPNGYTEVQEDKTTHFVWEEVTTDGNI